MPIGTLINATAIIVGGIVGHLFHKSFPKKIQEIIFQGLGLSTLLVGIQPVNLLKGIHIKNC